MNLKEFEKDSTISDEVISKYRDKVSPEVVDMWKEHGTGSFMGGYFRIINPDDYSELIEATYFRGKDSVPLFITAFGEVITYEENSYIGMIKYNICDFEIINKGINGFFECLEDDEYIKDFFDIKLFEKSKNKFGKLALDESYGFFPLLPLGGKKDVYHMDKVKTREHIELIAQLVGKVGMD
jgi:hypothetical protein